VVSRTTSLAGRPGGFFLQRVVESARHEVHRLFDLHDRLYEWIAGVHPARRPWHCQWLSVKDLYSDLHRTLPRLRGNLVDVGCLGKPYARWLTGVASHVGLDVTPAATVDYVIREGERWPLESGAFQSLLCSQVLEVVEDVPHVVREIERVLEPGGIAVISTPFTYNDTTTRSDDGVYKDLWRHSFYGSQALFAQHFDVVEARREGGFGSTVGVLVLNWINVSMSKWGPARLVMVVLLPVWLIACISVNVVGCLLDRLDRTGNFYHNVLLVLRKKSR